MKKKRQMQYLNFLKKNLKKTKILVLMFFISIPLYPLYPLDLACVLESKSLICSVSAEEVKGRNILRSMEIGHRAEIEYRIKIYKKENGFFNIFGDKLVRDISYSYIGKKDPINGQYHIVSEKKGKQVFNSEKSFLESFYILDNYKINLSGEKKGDYYVLGRVDLKVIKLVPPFNLFSIIIPGIVESTDWIKADQFRIE